MIPEPLPDRLVVPTRRATLVMVLALAVMLFAVGLYVAIPDGYWRVGRLVLGAAVSLSALVPAIQVARRLADPPPALVLDAGGLSVPAQSDVVGPVAWSEVTRVEVVPVFQRGDVVMISVRDRAALRRPRPWWRQRSFGELEPDLAINPSLTSYDAAELVALIEAYRRAARSDPKGRR